MHEVIKPRGIFFNKDHELATEPKYLGLHEWETRSTVSPLVALVNRRKTCIRTSILMMYNINYAL